MGLFSGFSKQQNAVRINWIGLNSVDQISEIVEQSSAKLQVIFKHSIRCGISSAVIKQLEKAWDLEEAPVDMYYLDLIRNRSVSDQVASELNIWHESPQLIVIKNGVVVAHGSHSGAEIGLIKSNL